jgi:Arc/MetJ family transcription regulator
MTAFDPHRIRPWVGPAPDPPLRLLLTACLAAPPLALRRWQEWLELIDFDHDNGAGFELAALAVARLGKAAGNGSVAARCLGLQRRSWLLSSLALRAAEQLGAAAARNGLTLLAQGDLASHLEPIRCGDQPLPVRRLELVVMGAAGGFAGLAARRAVATLERCALEGAAGEAVRTGRLPLQINTLRLLGSGQAASAHHAPPQPSALPGVLLPDPGEHLVGLIVQGWRCHPPAGLRWIVELTRRCEPLSGEAEPAAGAANHGHPDLVAAVVTAMGRRGERAAVGSALQALVQLEGCESLAPLQKAIEPAGAPSPVSRWRLRRRLRSPLRTR